MQERPESPCIGICTLDDESDCMGCRRTMDEIVRWSGMSAAEQWTVVRRTGSRIKLLSEAQHAPS